MPIVKENNLELNKGNLFDRKGFIMKEDTELVFNVNEVDFAQICIESKRYCKPGKVKGTLRIIEEKKLWLSADAILSSPKVLEGNVESIKKAIKYAKVDKDKVTLLMLSTQLKAIKKLINQTKGLLKYAKEINKSEFDERQKILNKK